MVGYSFQIVREGIDGFSYVSITENAWDELTEYVGEHSVVQPFSFFSPQSQLETPFYMACRSACVPAVSGSPYNLPLSMRMIEAVNPDLLVIEGRVIEELMRGCKYIVGENFPVKRIIIVGGKEIDIKVRKELFPRVSWDLLCNPLL